MTEQRHSADRSMRTNLDLDHDGDDSGVYALRDNVSTVHHTAGHVLAVAGRTCSCQGREEGVEVEWRGRRRRSRKRRSRNTQAVKSSSRGEPPK